MRKKLTSEELEAFRIDLASKILSADEILDRWGMIHSTANRYAHKLGYTLRKDGTIDYYRPGCPGRKKGDGMVSAPRPGTVSREVYDWILEHGIPASPADFYEISRIFGSRPSRTRNIIARYLLV